MYFIALVFVTVFTVANKIWVFVQAATAKAQSVRRLATDWTFRSSNTIVDKINTTSSRFHTLLYLHHIRKWSGRTKYSAVEFYEGRLHENFACCKTNFPMGINVKQKGLIPSAHKSTTTQTNNCFYTYIIGSFRIRICFVKFASEFIPH